MSNKLSEVQARMNGVHGLESVVGAMRGIAAARSREARSRLDGIRACARIVSAAIGDALLLIDDHASHETAGADTKRDEAMVIVLCAEQGFVGTFNEHVIDAALASSTAYARTEYLLLGDRGIVAATERGLNVGRREEIGRGFVGSRDQLQPQKVMRACETAAASTFGASGGAIAFSVERPCEMP